jgi:hypothetical protein
MVTKLQVGNNYNVLGIGKWSEYRQDLRVIAVTTAQEMENIDYSIYDEWFMPYEVPESVYQKMLDDNEEVYQCKIIESRSLSIIDSGSTNIYIFPTMINYSETSELVVCKSYSWEIHTRPYKERDRFNPLTRLPTDMTDLLTAAIKPFIFDAVTAYSNEQDIIVSQNEYEMFTKEREDTELSENSKTVNSDSEIQDQLQKMYAIVENAQMKEEKIRLTQLAADDYLKIAVRKFNDNDVLSKQLTVRDSALRLKYASLASIIIQVNQNLPPEDQIILPPYNELGVS